MTDIAPQVYPTLVKTALAAVDDYKGTTEGYETVMALLLALDGAIQQTDIAVPLVLADVAVERERRFIAQHGGPAATINDLLLRGDQAARAFLSQLFAGNKGARLNAELLGITFVNSPYIFMPPEAPRADDDDREYQESLLADDNGEWPGSRFEKRLQQVLLYLESKELGGVKIHWDDLIIYRGTVVPNQMREASYHIIDIVPWNMQIAVCDQIGNALFVVPQRLSLWEWTQYGKIALTEKCGAAKIVMNKDWRLTLDKVLPAIIKDAVMTVVDRNTIRIAQFNAKSGRCLITDDMRALITSERERTCCGPTIIHRHLKHFKFSRTIINTWFTKDAEDKWCALTIPMDYFVAIINCYKSLPTAVLLDQKDKPDDLMTRREKLAALMLQKHKGHTVIFGGMTVIPQGLTPNHISDWINKIKSKQSGQRHWRANSANAEHFYAVMSWLEQQPNYVAMDENAPAEEMTRQQKYMILRQQTGLSSTDIIARLKEKDELPAGLTRPMLDNIMPKKTRSTNIFREDYYDVVIGCLMDALNALAQKQVAQVERLTLAI